MKAMRYLSVGLTALCLGAGTGASVVAQTNEPPKLKLGIAMAEFDDNFPTLLREAMSKEARKQGWKPVFADGHSD